MAKKSFTVVAPDDEQSHASVCPPPFLRTISADDTCKWELW